MTDENSPEYRAFPEPQRPEQSAQDAQPEQPAQPEPPSAAPTESASAQQPESWTAPESSAQPESPAQSASAQQPESPAEAEQPPVHPTYPMYAEQYGESGYHQPATSYGDTSTYGQYGQPGEYGQYTQPSAYGHSPQPGYYGQQAQSGQSQYGQPSQYGQHSQYGQSSQYGQYGRPSPYAQPGQPGDSGTGGPPALYGAPAGPPPARPKRLTSSRRTLLTAAVIAALIGGGVGAGTVALAGNGGTPSASAGLTFSTQQAPASKVDGTVAAAAAKIGPSVVTINVRSQQEADTGSGVIIRSDGYILTNNHVISTATNGSGQIQVVFKDGTTATATIVGTDPSDDLAVIKVDKTGLTAAAFASSANLVVGQTVVAVGAPLGLSDTVTSGIVSNLTRPVTTSDNNNQATFNAIQTDAAINPGNSGGPLVNLNGDVVGINAAIASDQSQGGLQVPGQQSQPGNIGIGFAIPSDEASRIANQLIATGHATHAMIGVELNASTQTSSSGAQVQSVQPNTPAAEAGLQAGDVITKLGDQLIPDAESLIAAVRSHAPGQKVTLTYVRGNGSPKQVTLTLGTSTD